MRLRSDAEETIDQLGVEDAGALAFDSDLQQALGPICRTFPFGDNRRRMVGPRYYLRAFPLELRPMLEGDLNHSKNVYGGTYLVDASDVDEVNRGRRLGSKRLKASRLAVEELMVRARSNGKGPRHTIWLASRSKAR